MTYTNNSVLIGNWAEERLKQEYDFKLFLRKRDRRELLLQRSRTLFSNLLMEKTPSISGHHVLFGYNVQVVASDMPAPKRASQEKESYGLALSTLVSPRQVDYIQNISEGCLMTLSPIKTPCCRNTFVILSTDDDTPHGTKVNYGDEFYLRSENYGDPEARPLYVSYQAMSAPSSRDRMPIYLSSKKDICARWTAIPLLKKDRLEGLGSAVQTNTKLLITSRVNDLNLCVMNQSWMQTFFGPECGVTCRNCIDRFKMHTAENVFCLVSDVETKSKN